MVTARSGTRNRTEREAIRSPGRRHRDNLAPVKPHRDHFFAGLSGPAGRTDVRPAGPLQSRRLPSPTVSTLITQVSWLAATVAEPRYFTVSVLLPAFSFFAFFSET